MLAALLAVSVAHLQPPPVDRLVALAWQDAAKPTAASQASGSDDLQVDPKHAQDLKNDEDMGEKYVTEIDKELKESKDTASLQRIQRIGADLAAIANRTHLVALWGDKRFSPFTYRFKLVEGKDVNAFSLPGGTVYVYEGLVKYVQSDDELAGVLAHEISHAALRHVATLQSEERKMTTFQLPLILASLLIGGPGAAAGTLGATNLVGTAVGNGWSVKAEEAADYGGFQLLTKSKYNPTGMLTVMERLAQDERNGPNIDWGIYRDHPPSRERAEALKKDMHDAGIPIRRSAVSTSCRASVRPGIDGNVDILYGRLVIVSFGGENALKRADDAVARLNDFFDSEPEVFEVRAGDDGAIVGRRSAVLTLTADDAKAAKTTLDALQQTTLKNLKTALYGLSYRVWDGM